MKKPARLSTLAFAALLSTVATPALATGTIAGTLIENTAEATYASGAGSISVRSNTVTIKVDELLDVVVAANAANQPSPDKAIFAFDVTNTGNGPEAFNIVIDTDVAGNEFQLLIDLIVIDDGDGVYEPGIDTVLPAGSPLPVMSPDQSIRIFVITSLPEGATDGQSSTIELKAEAVTGTGAPGTNFPGQGEGGGDAVVGTTNAVAIAPSGVKASLATVSLVKSATIVDPFGGAQPLPGATVTYSIVADVVGSGTVSDLHVIDAIPAGTTYSAGSLVLDGKSLTDGADGDAGKASQEAGIDVSFGDVAGGNSFALTFKVKIN